MLYIHGLEAGPRGQKSRTLADAGFSVVSKQMPCGRKQAMRDPLLLAGAAGAVLASTVVGLAVSWLGALACAATVVVCGFAATPYYFRRMLRRSVEVQLRALTENRVDVVVGSSFGGAVAVELLRRGAWSGPTVLLCPAQGLIARTARLPRPAPLAALGPQAKKIVVVHSHSDETVPFDDSKALVAGSMATLIEVQDDHRLSTSATVDAFIRWIQVATA